MMNKINVKSFPESDPISIEHRDVFYDAYKNSPVAVSDMCFESLFGWQGYFGYRVARYKNFLLVFYSEKNNLIFLPPYMIEGRISGPGWVTDLEEFALALKVYCDEQKLVPQFSYFPETYTARLDRTKFDIIDLRDNYDYVYDARALAELSGQAYSPKRNLIKQFKRNFDFRYEPLTKNNLFCALRFIRKFSPPKTPVTQGLGSGEYRMIFRLLKNWDRFRITGGVLFVGKKEVAATIGTIVDDFQYPEGNYPTVIVQTEHALTEHKGSFQIINQLFCSSLPENIVYVNREEDLGIPGLRKAKLSYPHRFLKKSRVLFL
jgi:uncharacterized protein